MKRALAGIVIVGSLFFALPLYADFDAIVSEIETHGGLHRVRVPLLGLARFAVWIARPKGVFDFQLATWEGESSIAPNEASAIVRRNAGRGFSPVVETHSRRDGEWSFIYARPHGERTIELLIVSHDNSDTVVLRAVVDAVVFSQDVGGEMKLTRLGR